MAGFAVLLKEAVLTVIKVKRPYGRQKGSNFLIGAVLTTPKLKLTARAVAKLTAPTESGKQTLYWDADLRGFAVQCSGTTSSRLYIAQRDLPDGRHRRVTIGAVNEVDVDDAREQARDALHSIRKGVDPKQK